MSSFGWTLLDFFREISDRFGIPGDIAHLLALTVDGRKLAPPGMYKTLYIMGHFPYQLVQVFFHQQKLQGDNPASDRFHPYLITTGLMSSRTDETCEIPRHASDTNLGALVFFLWLSARRDSGIFLQNRPNH